MQTLDVAKATIKKVQRLRFFADGQWQQSATDKYMDVYDPSTGEVIAQTPCCTEKEVHAAIQSAKKAFPAWSQTPVMKRAQVLYRFRELLEAHVDELTRMVARENGKVWEEARGHLEGQGAGGVCLWNPRPDDGRIADGCVHAAMTRCCTASRWEFLPGSRRSIFPA